MTPSTRLVVAVAMASLPLLARAEGKCDDDPVQYGPAGQLVVTWAIPYPKDALVKITDVAVFNQVDQQLGLDWFPLSYPAKYKNPKLVNYFNDTELHTAVDLKNWEAFQSTMPATTVAAFDDYVKQGHYIRAALVEHPKVNPTGYSLCTCVLQRGVVIYYPGNKQEDLYVRSHFSSTNPAQKAFEVFAPNGGWWFSFKRDKIWFPVRLNRLLQEDAWMVLDILTPKGKLLPTGAIKPPYSEVKRGRVTLFGQEFEAVRVLGTFQKGNAATDLEIAAP